jgi:hypothetical protein
LWQEPCFYCEVSAAIISAVITRIRGGSSFRAGPLELGADLKSLEYAPPNTSNHEDDTHGDDWSAERTALYQHNRGVFLTHIISPSTKPGQKYDIFIYLIRHKTSDFNDVERAEFFFGHMWGNTVFEERENNGMIGFQPPRTDRSFVHAVCSSEMVVRSV